MTDGVPHEPDTGSDEVAGPDEGVARRSEGSGSAESIREWDEQQRARDLLAAAMRRLGHAVAGHELPEDEAEELRTLLEERATAIESRPRRDKLRDPRWVELYRAVYDGETDKLVDDDGYMRIWRNSPVSGASNPLGVAIDIAVEGKDAVAIAHLGSAWEGAPDRAHGGVLAAICDELMGAALPLSGELGYTGKLEVRYIAPTPVESDVEFRARVLDRKGRRIRAEAVGFHQGRKVIEAKGLFVSVSAERRASLTASDPEEGADDGGAEP